MCLRTARVDTRRLGTARQAPRLASDDSCGPGVDLHKLGSALSGFRGQPLPEVDRLDVVTELLVYAPAALALLVLALIVLCGPSTRGFERLVRLIEAWRRP